MTNRASVDVRGWDEQRRTDASVRDYFAQIGDVVSVDTWFTPSTVRVTFASPDAARRAVALLHGSRVQGCEMTLSVKQVAEECARCAELEAQLARLTRQQQQHQPPPPPRRQTQPEVKRGRTFSSVVREKLGEQAAKHITERIPPHVADLVAQTCDKAYIFTVDGDAPSVSDRREYVVELRRSMTRVKGILAVFFEWHQTRIVAFVNSTVVAQMDVDAHIQSAQFRDKFGDFIASVDVTF